MLKTSYCPALLDPFLPQTLDSLQKAVADGDSGVVDELLVSFAEQCRQEMAVRYLAGQKGAYPAVLAACRLACEEGCSLLKALRALSTLLDGQPDFLDAPGQELLLRVLRERQDDGDLTLATIRCVRQASLKHEQNRQDLVKGGVLSLLVGAVVRHGDRADVVREACAGLRFMTFDDDIRVPFGHAHEHAKMIVTEHGGLRVLIEAAKGRSVAASSPPRGTQGEPFWIWPEGGGEFDSSVTGGKTSLSVFPTPIRDNQEVVWGVVGFCQILFIDFPYSTQFPPK